MGRRPNDMRYLARSGYVRAAVPFGGRAAAGGDTALRRWSPRHSLADSAALLHDTVLLAALKLRAVLRHGASFLFAADVGNWDRTRFLLLPGQSADPQSSHYSDFFEPWLAGSMAEWPFSRAAVNRATVRRFTLSPR
ncbi:penicillin acylase family protein [Tsuneonella amylolytica]|uniref:penicillin acylase family protein n=1 Tax=Tsuneonella amylolytica TaxID=2338327 RepID=UPI000EA906D8|nr:penicillin acylase family protein [Tsuneonella amylolytica]